MNIFELLQPEEIKNCSLMQTKYEDERIYDEESRETKTWYSGYSNEVGFPVLPCVEFYNGKTTMFITKNQYETFQNALINGETIDDYIGTVYWFNDVDFSFSDADYGLDIAVWDEEKGKIQVFEPICENNQVIELEEIILPREITQEKINEILEKHKLWLENPELGERADFSNCNLRNIDFSNQTLRNVIFRETDLRGANFSNSSLEKADLSHANLQNANLKNAWLISANLEESNLIHANLQNANLEEANLYLADLENANLSETYLLHADMRYVKLLEANLYKATLRNADLYNADLEGANLENTDLIGVDLCKANLCNCNLINAQLIISKLRNSIFDGADLSNANLEGANLEYAYFRNVNLKGANLNKTILENVNFKNADFTEIGFVEWDKVPFGHKENTTIKLTDEQIKEAVQCHLNKINTITNAYKDRMPEEIEGIVMSGRE